MVAIASGVSRGEARQPGNYQYDNAIKNRSAKKLFVFFGFQVVSFREPNNASLPEHHPERPSVDNAVNLRTSIGFGSWRRFVELVYRSWPAKVFRHILSFDCMDYLLRGATEEARQKKRFTFLNSQQRFLNHARISSGGSLRSAPDA